MTTSPHRPTAAPDQAVERTIQAAAKLAAEGTPRREAAERLVADAPDRETLHAASITLTRRMGHGRSDDFAAAAALRLLFSALELLPLRSPAAGTAEAEKGRRRRRRIQERIG